MNKNVQWLSHYFSVHQHNENWNNVGGIYIFTGLTQQNQWAPLYIGQTDSLSNRIPQHEQWTPAVRLGATHVHVMTVSQQAMRDKIEKELIQNFQPRLNTHHK
jgi:excinuclease UvrABC nuclease subunit